MSAKKMTEFQVKYKVSAIVGVGVYAESMEAAKEKADKVVAKDIFIEAVDYIDGNNKYIGIDNLDEWELK